MSSKIPRSVRHKQILDAAENNPEASIETIATDISGVTVQDVERVLEEYGDPAEDNGDQPAEIEDPSEATDEDGPALDDLSPKQRELVQTIYHNPDATQREVAEMLDVSPATICNRAHSIEGFDWDLRQSVVESLVEGNSSAPTEAPSQMSSPNTTHHADVDQLADRVTALEDQVDTMSTQSVSARSFDDLELLQKVIHACMDADTISEEEELQILQALLQ